MCRMVGIVFRRTFPFAVLEDLRHVAEVGLIPGYEKPGHRDGWGTVSFVDGSPKYLIRSPMPMHEDPSFKAVLKEIPRLATPNILITHARAASEGGSSLANTHPFVIGKVAIAHNGTIYDYHPRTTRIPEGETDSERLSLVIAERFQQTHSLRTAIERVVSDDLAKHEFSAAILLASDGEALYGYRDYSDEKKANYYDLNLSVSEDHVALFQESKVQYRGNQSRIAKGELVSVDTDLKVTREMIG